MNITVCTMHFDIPETSYLHQEKAIESSRYLACELLLHILVPQRKRQLSQPVHFAGDGIAVVRETGAFLHLLCALHGAGHGGFCDGPAWGAAERGALNSVKYISRALPGVSLHRLHSKHNKKCEEWHQCKNASEPCWRFPWPCSDFRLEGISVLFHPGPAMPNYAPVLIFIYLAVED